MKYLIVSDIHGNREALQAVLADAAGKYDTILCCGDLCGYGADPNAIIDWARRNVAVCVAGNHDAAIAGSSDIKWFNAMAKEAAHWTQRQLRPENLEYLRHLPHGPVHYEGIDLVHGSPLREFDYLTNLDDVMAISHLLSAPVTFFGHTHDQVGFKIKPNGKVLKIDPERTPALKLASDSKYIVNPGSVGQPRDQNPNAAYVIYSPRDRSIKFQRVEYDVKAAGNKILDAGLPEHLASRLLFGV